ncbi:metallophosphoesterase [Rhodococcus pyridinivorans]|uniref:metallophosphoesterase n=1 Tax=Rhodococcus pyridinivorans TaxID=103816 RepID=UPI0020C5C174|nr:metallophosphoesterase [Rhodococcus pyridinivorans]UTM35402.1 metallophosphoesterase [Rhodococcus pyridinivorans]
MLRLLVVGVFLALLTYLLHRRLVRAPGLPRPAALAADLVLVVLFVLTLGASGVGTVLDPAWARPIGFLGWSWLAVVLYLMLGLLLIGVALFVARLTRRGQPRPITEDGTVETPRRGLRIATAVLVVAAVAAVGYGTIEADRPQIVTVPVALQDLPAGFDGARIALVTDLHVGPSRGADFVQGVVDLVAEEQPDLIVLGGDLADGTVELVGSDLEPLRQLQAPLGVYGVSGNHEYYSDDAESWLNHWETLGVRTLRNDHVVLERGGDVVALAGVHDYTAPEPHHPDMPAALAGIADGTPVILAAHQPRHVDEARELGVDLQLSGHTHGGQMWPLRPFVSLANPTVTGLDRFGDTQIYTSQGTGAWGPPVRVGTPPEISVLELTAAN